MTNSNGAPSVRPPLSPKGLVPGSPGAPAASLVTWPGADAFAAFTSVIQTLLKKGAPSTVVEALADLFCAPRSESAPA